ncbi:MAG: DUF1844 domain-containing protein [Deltaproteobacteria bacterium]|nr:DUF1844 domain-containing protein [Deltaproteobacteria bacterium]
MSDTTGEDSTKRAGREAIMPKTNFVAFILSLNSSALVHLGAENDPMAGTRTKNLALAKQTIDLLVMLAEKTRGNLEKDEERLLTNVVYELRLLYVKEKKAD